MPFLNEIIARLEANNVGTLGVDIFASSFASMQRLESGAVLNIIETGGSGGEYIQNMTTKPAYTNPSAQIMASGVDYETARAKAQAAYDVFTGANITLGTTFYRSIRPLNDILDQKPDGVGNARCSFNILAKRRA